MLQLMYSRGSDLGEVRGDQPELSLEDNIRQGMSKGTGWREARKEHRGLNLHDK